MRQKKHKPEEVVAKLPQVDVLLPQGCTVGEADLLILRGVPGHVRSNNGPEFVAKAFRDWITSVGAKCAFIGLGSPWENGYSESFDSKLCDEPLQAYVASSNGQRY